MTSSESELQPETRSKGWAEYVNDPDTVCIALYQRMSALVCYPKVAECLTLVEQVRFGANDFDTATKFCTFVLAQGRDLLFDGVLKFLAHEGAVVNIKKHDKDPHLDYPVKLHVALAFHYSDTKIDELLKPTLAAIYSNNPLDFPQCLPGTRVSLIEQVLAITTSNQPSDQPLLVAGSAGTGKSALSASVLQALKDQHIPVLSFICKHDVPERSNPQLVIPTLAWQLSKYPLHRGGVEKALRKLEAESSNAVAISPVQQIELLTTLPSLGSSLQRPVILIDALDECGQTASRKQLIRGFIDKAKVLCSRFTVIIVSRPIDQIEKEVRPRTWTVVDLDELLQSDGTTADLNRFFGTELEELAPTSGEIKDLVVAANGLFVWARVACSYILLLYDPTDAKQALGGFCSGLAPAGSSEPLYELYRRTLHDYLFAASRRMPTQNLELFHRVISSILFTEVTLSAAGIAWLVDRSETAVESLLDRLRPLLAPRNGSSTGPVRLLHASVDDFFRSLADGDSFFVPSRHAQCFHRCFVTMVAELSFNVAGVTDPRESMYNRANLEDVRASVSEPLKYACFQWAWHLSSLRSLDSASLKAVEHFFETVFLYWSEFVGVFNRVSEAAEWLQRLASIAEDPLREICNDASEFLRHYPDQLERSPRDVYLSALPLAQQQSTIAEYYCSFLPNGTLPRITIGYNTSRIAPSLIHSSNVWPICFSPIDDTVLTVTENAIKVFDSINGAQIAVLTLPGSKFQQGYYSATGQTIVAHSQPNPSSLDGDHDADKDEVEVTLWDTSAYKMTKLKTESNPYTTGFSLEEYYPERNVALFKGNNKLLAVWDLGFTSTRRQELGEVGVDGHVSASRDGSTVLVTTQATLIHNTSNPKLPMELWRAATPADPYVNIPLPVWIKADDISNMAISSEGSKMTFCCSDGIVVVDLRLWSGLLIKTPDMICSVRFTADVLQLVTLSYENTVTAYDLTGRMLWSSNQMPTRALAVSHDGGRFAFVRYSDWSKVQICVAGQSTAESEDDSDHQMRLAQFSVDGQRLLTVGEVDHVQQWDPLAGKRLASLAVPFGFDDDHCAMSPDGSLFAVVGYDTVSCLRTSTGKLIWTRTFSEGLVPSYGLNFAFSPNNAHLVWTGRFVYDDTDYCMFLLDAASGELLEQCKLLDGGLEHVAFSADSSRICGFHHQQKPAGIVIWTVNNSKPYLQFQAQSSTDGSGDEDSQYQVVWTADMKVVTITSSPEPTLICWDSETCIRLAVVRISIPKHWEGSRDYLSMLVNLVAPVFVGGLKLPTWLAESTDQVIRNQDGVQCRDITLLDRWRNLVFIPIVDYDGDNVRLAEHEYPNGSKIEIIRRSDRAIVIHYPSEDPWANFCETMKGFQMPEGQLLPFFEAKRNFEVPSTPFSEQDSTTENSSSSGNDHPINVELSTQSGSNDSSARLQPSAAATSSHGSISTLKQGQTSASKKQGWRERLGIKHSKNKGKGKAD